MVSLAPLSQSRQDGGGTLPASFFNYAIYILEAKKVIKCLVFT